MKDYEGWDFKNKSFLVAVAISVLWHLFWFFSVTIVVNPHKRRLKQQPVVVSLGPVLDDTIFRTLVEARPQVSQAFYRRLSDFSGPVELEVKTLARPSPGEVVGLPFGKRVWESVRGVASGSKIGAEDELGEHLKISDMKRSSLDDLEEEEKKKRRQSRANS